MVGLSTTRIDQDVGTTEKEVLRKILSLRVNSIRKEIYGITHGVGETLFDY